MHPDDIDIRRPLPQPSGAPVWQVVAVVALLAAAGLLVLSLGLGMVLYFERIRPRTPPVGAKAAMPFVPGQAAGGDGWQEPANPPYPVVQDLRPTGRPPVPGEAPEAEPGKTPRRRFLDITREAWEAPPGSFPQELSVSPDRQSVAYVDRQGLFVGPRGDEGQQVGGGGAGRRQGRPGTGGAAGPAVRVTGRPAWSADSRHVFFADHEGRLRRCDPQGQTLETLPFPGDSPVPVPPDGQKLVFRRARATPKVDLPGAQPVTDPKEIVLADLDSGQIRVLVPDSGPLLPRAVSADGKRLALLSVWPPQPKEPGRARLSLLDLDDPRAEPHRIGPVATTLTGVSWTADGKALVYARSQQPLPPDCWDSSPGGLWDTLDLFRLDVATREENRLSRGGGFGPPSLAGDEVFFPVWQSAADGGAVHLQCADLKAVRDFDSKEPALPAHDLDAWTKVLDDSLDRANVSPQAQGEALPPDVLTRLADTFAKAYKEHFETDSPADAVGWERARRELRGLGVPPPQRPKFSLVLGAAQGEYLRRKHGAEWYMGAGPLVPKEMPADKVDEENPFGLILNPYRATGAEFAGGGGDDEDDGDESAGPSSWLRDALVRARGRTLLLTNDPAAAKDALHELADHDLTKAGQLYENKHPADGDKLLLELIGQKKYAPNDYLVLCVGKLLYEHGRHDALRRLLEPRVDVEPRDAHRYNLLGLALLESDPSAAAQQFKNALRCDLAYGPAWLNLAEAYARAKEPAAATQCLRHFLHTLPFTPYTDDARQRLAALQAGRPGQ
jgi:tetratricopeptide (TPR) repeat protein